MFTITRQNTQSQFQDGLILKDSYRSTVLMDCQVPVYLFTSMNLFQDICLDFHACNKAENIYLVAQR